MDPAAIVFDLDGVLVDSEQVWDSVRQALVAERGGHWTDEATTAMQGMSTPEWAAYLGTLGARGTPEQLAAAVIERMAGRYREHVPLLPGAVDAVRALAGRWPLAVASSSPPDLIRVVLDAAGVADRFRVTVSSEEVNRGKPAPDVYLAAAQRLGVDPAGCVAVEDSSNGLRAAAAAGMTVVAVPNPHFPPPADALALAAATVRTPAELTPELIAAL
ncbi:MAG TPA: HAD family phosphatase [Mycobacteriales bacterium]|nr:HAD family phosphatase [Mycobacteriales bacterium]